MSKDRENECKNQKKSWKFEEEEEEEKEEEEEEEEDFLEIIIIIIIIMSWRLYGYPWPSLATSPYHSSPPAGLHGYIPYPHMAAGCMFELVVLFCSAIFGGP